MFLTMIKLIIGWAMIVLDYDFNDFMMDYDFV